MDQSQRRFTKPKEPNRVMQIALAAGATYALTQLPPLKDAQGTAKFIASCATALLIATGLPISALVAQKLAAWSERIAAMIPSRTYEDSGFIRHIRDYGQDVKRFGWGPYWGALRQKSLFGLRTRLVPVISNFESVAAVFGPPGSNKSVGLLFPNALSIIGSKILIAFKSTEALVLSKALMARSEAVHIVDLGGLLKGKFEQYARYNPLHLIVKNFWRPGGLAFVVMDARRFALQLLPEKQGGNQDNRFFRDGARDLIVFCIVVLILVEGRRAHFGMVLNMLSDRESLLRHAEWAAGRLIIHGEDGSEGTVAHLPLDESPWAKTHSTDALATFAEVLASMGASVADLLNSDDAKYSEAFLKGAQQALAPFESTSQASQAMRDSDFDAQDLRDTVCTVIFALDASRIAALGPVASLCQDALITDLMRNPDQKRPVTILADEMTNAPPSANLPELISYSRGFGLRLLLIAQFHSLVRQRFGEDGLRAILNAAEILLYMPGQREESTIKSIQTMIGDKSVVTRGRNAGHGHRSDGIDQTTYGEQSRPRLSVPEIRQLKESILFLKGNAPALVETPPYAAMSPFRDQAGADPTYGNKPWRLPVKLRFERRDGPWPIRMLIRRLRKKRILAERRKHQEAQSS